MPISLRLGVASVLIAEYTEIFGNQNEKKSCDPPPHVAMMANGLLLSVKCWAYNLSLGNFIEERQELSLFRVIRRFISQTHSTTGQPSGSIKA